MQQILQCPNCSRPVADWHRFCGYCGTCLVRMAKPVPVGPYPPEHTTSNVHQPDINIPQNNISSPLRNEILKLLEHLVYKQRLNN